MCDRKPPKAVTFIGAVLISVGFSLMGPLPFFQLEKTVGIVVAGLVIHGFGLGAEVVAGFADAHKSVRKRLRGNRRRSSDSPLLTAKIEFSAFLGHCQWVS